MCELHEAVDDPQHLLDDRKIANTSSEGHRIGLPDDLAGGTFEFAHLASREVLRSANLPGLITTVRDGHPCRPAVRAVARVGNRQAHPTRRGGGNRVGRGSSRAPQPTTGRPDHPHREAPSTAPERPRTGRCDAAASGCAVDGIADDEQCDQSHRPEQAHACDTVRLASTASPAQGDARECDGNHGASDAERRYQKTENRHRTRNERRARREVELRPVHHPGP